MKRIIFITIFLSTGFSGFSQNILESLQLKDDKIRKYVGGELTSTDTVVDLKNGYYEEFHSDDGNEKTILRQAAIFKNNNGTKTLGISVCEWDFACFVYTSNFYEITQLKDSIIITENSDIIPPIDIEELVIGTKIISILNKYLPKLQGKYLDSNATISKLLNEVYDIQYIIPREGTTLIATLGVCDYIPTNEIEINIDDWEIIENDFLSMELMYDKKQKRFKKPSIIKN